MTALTSFSTVTNMARVGMNCRPCPYCDKEHEIVCPRVRKITWAEDSTITSVELHEKHK